MAATQYLVTTPVGAAAPKVNGSDAMIVVAENSTDAKAIAKSYFDGDCNGLWGNATVTALTGGADFEGWVFTLNIYNASGVRQNTDQPVTYTGTAGATLDNLGTGMATALVAAGFSTAAYNASSQVLTIGTSGSSGASIGNFTYQAKVTPPAATYGDPQPITGFLSSVATQGGAATNALSLTLAADGYTIPKVVSAVKQV